MEGRAPARPRFGRSQTLRKSRLGGSPALGKRWRAHMSQQLQGKRVLLVDDDNDILTSMQASFEPTGATIDLASNGNKAAEIFDRTNPDLVILDMMLPGRSGFLVLEHIQREKNKAKKPRTASPFVIMITGNTGARHKMYA